MAFCWQGGPSVATFWLRNRARCLRTAKFVPPKVQARSAQELCDSANFLGVSRAAMSGTLAEPHTGPMVEQYLFDPIQRRRRHGYARRRIRK
jgi:hypothetical protein